MNTNSTDGICPKCGKPYYYIGDPSDNWADNICKCAWDNKMAINLAYGWMCPICGNVMAPWVAQCPGYHGRIVTSTDNITVAP